ncbi:MAG: SpoIIE family protein phosphatase [Cellvibrionaceae bacterium]
MSSAHTLLVIDDELLLRESICAYLEDSGFNVVSAAGGKEGLKLFEELTPSIVLTDLRMPDVDGLEVLKEVGKHSADTPVIVVSGAGDMRDVVEAMRLGAADYITKPLIDMEVLVHSVTRSLEQQNLRDENKRYREQLERANHELSRQLGLLRQDHRAGREAQQRLMPESPAIYNGFHISHEVEASLYLSGDLVSHSLHKKRYLEVTLLDVSGHGAASAFVTLLLRHWIEQAMEQIKAKGPVQVLEQLGGKLNTQLRDLGLDKHATGFVGVVDTETHVCHYIVAGHLPLPLYVHNGEGVWLENTGPPLGMLPEGNWQSQELPLEIGDTLSVCSDGMLEVLEGTVPEREELLKQHLTGGDMDVLKWIRSSGCVSVEDLPDDISVLMMKRVD